MFRLRYEGLSLDTSEICVNSLLFTAVPYNFYRSSYALLKFVYCSSTELSNKVFSMDQIVFFIKTFYAAGGSYVTVERQYLVVFCARCTVEVLDG
jgi:hypothetical protein